MTTVQAEVVVQTEVDAAPDQVWRLLVDWDRQGDWIPFTRTRYVDGRRSASAPASSPVPGSARSASSTR